MASFALRMIIAIMVVTLLEDHLVSSQCCPSHSGKCNDGTSSGLCCGYRSCNFFCCSCGKCRARRHTRSITAEDAKGDDHFHKFDTDADGHHNLTESYKMATDSGCASFKGTELDFKSIFAKFDGDKDGKLSWDEVNSPHAKV